MCRATSSLEQARFGPQLRVTVDAAPDTLAVRLPPLLVQPLVENAIKHGKTDRPLNLLVRARAAPRPAPCDGARRRPRHRPRRDRARARARGGEGTGIGLANVNLRLTAHYGEGVKLRSFPFGTVVMLEVPV